MTYNDNTAVIGAFSPEATTLAADLSALLAVADACGFAHAAIHINEAIIALGGNGVPPPADR